MSRRARPFGPRLFLISVAGLAMLLSSGFAQDAPVTLTSDYFTATDGSIGGGLFRMRPGVSEFPTFYVNSQAGVTGGILEFYETAAMNAVFQQGVTDGTQRFYDHTVLRLQSALALAGGIQNFYGQSELLVETAGGFFSNATQNFSGDSRLLVGVANGLNDGQQFFSGNSSLVADAENAISHGGQYFSGHSRLEANRASSLTAGFIGDIDFSGMSHLRANASGAIAGAEIEFLDDAVMEINAVGAVTGGTQTFLGNSEMQLKVAGGLTGGTQTFRDISSLDASVAGAIPSGSLQAISFRDHAGMNANFAGAVAGGMLNFHENSFFSANVPGAVSGGQMSFADTSTLLVYAAGALAGGTQVFGGGSSLHVQVALGVSSGTLDFAGNSSFLRTAMPQAVTGGVQNFIGAQARFEAYASRSLDGGVQNFTGESSTLGAFAENAVSGGEQNFFHGSKLLASNPFGLSGGVQTFHDSSSLELGVFGANVNSVVGGVQNFYDDSFLRASVNGGVSGGVQSFFDRSHLDASAERAVSFVTLHLANESRIEIQAAQALDHTTSIVFDGNAPGSTGGRVNLNGHDLTVGRLTSINGGGRISNAGSGFAIATLAVDFDSGTSVFDGRIEDGLNGGGINLIKRGAGTLVLTAAHGYTGGTTVEGGALRLDFSAGHSPAQNIVHPDAGALGLAGGRLELVGKIGAANRQSFNSVELTKASRVALAPNGAASLELHLGDFGNFQREPFVTADFTIPASSAVTFSDVAGTPVLPWATVNNGAHFATLTPSGAGHAVSPLTTFANSRDGVDYDFSERVLHFHEPMAHTFIQNDLLNAILVSPGVGNNSSSVGHAPYIIEPRDDSRRTLLIHQYNTDSPLTLALDLGYAGAVTGYTLIKSGPGTLIYAAVARSVNPGGTFPIAADLRLVVNEGDVITDDDILGDVFLGTGSGLGGRGNVSGRIVMRGGALRPGRSPGTLTGASAEWGGDNSTYKWELNDAAGMAGQEASGWDLLRLNGALDVTATLDNRYILEIRTLTLGNLPGDAANFDPAMSYSWTIATAAGGITGFDAGAFTIEVSDFTNAYDGAFSLALGNEGRDLNLAYTPVPEPSTWALLLLGGGLLVGIARCHRPSETKHETRRA